MARYIDIKDYCKNYCKCADLENGCEKEKCKFWNGEVPTADIKEVVRGEWIEHRLNKGKRNETLLGYICSECKAQNNRDTYFCPNCGSDNKLRGVE